MVYLIDCENVGESGLSGIDQLLRSDEVILFYGKQQVSVSMDSHLSVIKAKCSVDIICADQSGRNYLDMQIATHLGYLLKAKPRAEFVIVSKDKGFDSVIDYVHSHGRMAYRRASILEDVEFTHKAR